MSARRLQTDLLAHAGRLLLEYNESTGTIHRVLNETAKALTGEPCQVAVSYGGVAVALQGEAPVLQPVRELRYNTAVQARVHRLLERVRRGDLEPAEAVIRLGSVERETECHPPWIGVLVLGMAAAGLAGLLGADAGSVAVAGVSTGLGLLARQQLGRRHFSLLALPFTAALIGSVLGGAAIQLGWTLTPELVLIVPALMLVPGPHLINGLMDLIDNFLPMSLARFGLAIGILVASALGIALGIELTLPGPLPDQPARSNALNLLSDVVLAGIVTVGFAVNYNTAWKLVGMAALGGMLGHGIRFLMIEAGFRLEVATFFGGLAVGVVSGWMARSTRIPVAIIAFAGAVTMMPGMQLYRAIGGAVRLTWLAGENEPALVAATFANLVQGCLAISGLGLGVILGARTLLALTGENDGPLTPLSQELPSSRSVRPSLTAQEQAP
jgi:uncharacterized membrane protein YjjP (DUF1212 family)